MRALVIASVVALTACASSRSDSVPVTPVQTVRVVDGSGGITQVATTRVQGSNVATISGSLDRAWDVLPGVYESLGIPVGQLQEASHSIGNPGFKVRRQLGGVPLTRYFDCGRMQDRPSAETYELHITVLTQLQQGETETTAVSTTLQATARPVNFASGIVQCSSTGALESRIAELLRALVQG